MTRALQFLAALLLAPAAVAQVNVLTYHNDLGRTGANTFERILTPANVNATQFGKLFEASVDGQVYAQPLYAANIAVPGKGTHNVVFVATEHDSIYAFDADTNQAPLWQVSFLDASAAVTSVPTADIGCGQISPEIGITSTPVIDLSTGTMYAVAMTKENGAYVHKVHALDIATGAEKPNSPVIVQATVPGTGDGGTTVTLVPKTYKQRSGLLLLNGVVYTSWASHCDAGDYHGWLIGYDTRTLQQVSVYNNTPNARGASFWTSGAAPAADASGNIFLVGGNGSFDGDKGGPDLGESFIKLTLGAAADYFTPYNYAALDSKDLDVGSSGALLLPDDAGSAAHPHLLVSAGKEGRIYILDRDNLGKWQANSDSQIVQSVTGAIGALFGIPAYFNNTIYFSGSGDNLKAFRVSNAAMAAAPSSKSSQSFGFPGGVPSISANGAANGIVWLSQNGLFAWDAADLSKLLFKSAESYVKFSTPTIADGKVYMGTANGLAVYGLLASASNIAAVVNAASFTSSIAPGSIVSVFGSALAQSAVAAGAYPLPDNLAGAALTVDGEAAPIFYASPAQINAQIPVDAAPGKATVSLGGASATIALQPSAPGIFLAEQTQSGTVTVYLTGVGQVDQGTPTGTAVTGTVNATQACSATIGGAAAAVTFCGLTPGFAGLGQMNLTVPAGLSPGAYPVVVTIGVASSNPATVAISGGPV